MLQGRAAESPDASQVHQQGVLLDGDVGGGLGQGAEGGVDAPQIPRLQADPPQQVSPLDVYPPAAACRVHPQHLSSVDRSGLPPATAGNGCSRAQNSVSLSV